MAGNRTHFKTKNFRLPY